MSMSKSAVPSNPRTPEFVPKIRDVFVSYEWRPSYLHSSTGPVGGSTQPSPDGPESISSRIVQSQFNLSVDFTSLPPRNMGWDRTNASTSRSSMRLSLMSHSQRLTLLLSCVIWEIRANKLSTIAPSRNCNPLPPAVRFRCRSNGNTVQDRPETRADPFMVSLARSGLSDCALTLAMPRLCS